MVRVKWRWILPLGHLTVDLVLVLALIAYSNRVFLRHRTALPSPLLRPALLFQESGSVEWDPRTSGPPGPFNLIMTGNLPVGLLTGTLRPEAGYIGRRQPWDPVWFLLYEALSFPCWFAIGTWIDAGRSRLGSVMIGFIAVRLLVTILGVYEPGWRVQATFWMGFVSWLGGFGILHFVRVSVRVVKRIAE